MHSHTNAPTVRQLLNSAPASAPASRVYPKAYRNARIAAFHFSATLAVGDCEDFSLMESIAHGLIDEGRVRGAECAALEYLHDHRVTFHALAAALERFDPVELREITASLKAMTPASVFALPAAAIVGQV